MNSFTRSTNDQNFTKTTFRLLILLLLFIPLWTACSSDDENQDTPSIEAEDGQLIATIDGQEVVYDSNLNTAEVEAELETTQGEIQLTISGSGIDDDSIFNGITITIVNPSQGTHSLASPSLNIASYFDGINFFFSNDAEPDTEIFQGSGTIQIVQFDIENNVVSGTFEFEAETILEETVTITNGSFSNIPIVNN